MNNQKKEIETIKPRNIIINLSDADVERIFEKVGEHNITVAQLIENFIGDLVDGTYTNGSDERYKANDYFERCWFGSFPEETFLKYLLNNCSLYDYLEMKENLKDFRTDLKYEEEENEPNIETIEEIKKEIAYCNSVLNNFYYEYAQSCKDNEPQTQEEAERQILKWYEDYKKMKEGAK